MSARFSHDEGYFHLHKIRYLKAVAETLIGIGDIFRIAIESITQLTDAEIVVRFKVQVRANPYLPPSYIYDIATSKSHISSLRSWLATLAAQWSKNPPVSSLWQTDNPDFLFFAENKKNSLLSLEKNWQVFVKSN